MLYLGCVFTMPNKSGSYKNQLIRSAAGWSKGCIVLSLIPADAHMKPVSGIKMNFPSIEIDSHPSRRVFSLDQQPGSHTILTWPRLHWWTLGFSVFPKTSNSTTVTLDNMEKSHVSCLHLAKGISETLNVECPPTTPSSNLEMLRGHPLS